MRTPRNERVGANTPAQTPGRDRARGRGAASAGGKGRRTAGAGESADSPERRCILSGESANREGLIRLAVSPPDADGRCLVLPDVLARAPGRGAWLGVTRAELETAMAKGKLKGALARAFKGAALEIPEDLPDRIEQALIRAFTERLGLESRAGKLLMGSDRIAEKARMGRVAWLAHAADAGEDGNRKLDQAWRVGQDAEGSGMGGVILPLDRARLSVALGRENVVHLALTDAGAAERLATILERLLHFLGPAATAGLDAKGNPPGHATQGGDDELNLKGCLTK